MRLWIDLANSPHVPLFEPVVREARARGHDVVLTARDHAQTVPLAKDAWKEVTIIGGKSPPGRIAKGRAIADRARALRLFARDRRPDVALSHGSYAQVVAARAARVPCVTMMDYDHQPANHLSFRLAQRVIVPQVFPGDSLRRFGARPGKVARYDGFKEELYLAGVEPEPAMLVSLGLDPARVTAAMRPPPEGALYHREGNARFDDILEHVLAQGAQVVLLPRGEEQNVLYERTGVAIPARPVDGSALLATVDLTVGAGGTMTRESALLGTPTYTVFLGELAAADAELIRQGRLVDLRASGVPVIERKPRIPASVDPARATAILETMLSTAEELAERHDTP
jgi:predicted glycosyltransferase